MCGNLAEQPVRKVRGAELVRRDVETHVRPQSGGGWLGAYSMVKCEECRQIYRDDKLKCPRCGLERDIFDPAERRHPVAEVAARAAAPIGAAFTLICLVTGSLWGRPMWGAWWVWDARLTSVLVLFFLYLGYIALVNGFDDPSRGGRAGSVLALVGVVNLPIIKFSVDWWNTLHQPASVLRIGGPKIDISMLVPLLVMAAGFSLLFLALVMLRMRTILNERKAMALRLNAGGERAPLSARERAAPAHPAVR